MQEGFVRPQGNGGGEVIPPSSPQPQPRPAQPIQMREPVSPPPGTAAMPQNPEPAMENVPPPLPVEEWPIKVKLLHKRLSGMNGEELTILTFREPTGSDINRCGNPCRINSDGDVVMDERKMTMIMAQLSGLLVPILDRMDPRDWNSCAYRLRNFFLPEVDAWLV